MPVTPPTSPPQGHSDRESSGSSRRRRKPSRAAEASETTTEEEDDCYASDEASEDEGARRAPERRSRPAKARTPSRRKSPPSRLKSTRTPPRTASRPPTSSPLPPVPAPRSHFAHLPAPAPAAQPWTSPLSPPLPKPVVRPRKARTHAVPPALERPSAAGDDESPLTSPSSAGGAVTPTLPRPIPLRRNRTGQALGPWTSGAVADIRTDLYDEDGDDDVEEIERTGLPTEFVYPVQEQRLVAGGKKAKLAVEMKMNLEIEIHLRAYIRGDLTLELFN